MSLFCFNHSRYTSKTTIFAIAKNLLFEANTIIFHYTGDDSPQGVEQNSEIRASIE